jgi:hypothetical protein
MKILFLVIIMILMMMINLKNSNVMIKGLMR